MSRWWVAALVVMMCHGVSAGFSEEDDAGSGTDAPDLFAASLLVGPGHYRGNLSGTNDLADSYGFVARELQVLRIDFSFDEGVTAKIVDPDGSVRGCLAFTNQSFSTVAHPFGAWEVRFDRSHCAGMVSALPRNSATFPAQNRLSYELRVDVEDHQHFERLELAEANDLTFELGLMAQQYGRLELDLTPNHAGAGPWATAQAVEILEQGVPSGSSMSAWIVSPSLGLGNPTVWSSGPPPDGASMTLPVTEALPPMGNPPSRLVIEGSPDVATEIAFGYVHTIGFRASGWLVWDETVQLDMLEGTSIVHKPMRDFQVDGTGFQVGPWVTAERANTTYGAGAPLELMYVNAWAPKLDSSFPPMQLAESRFEVVAPDGTRTHLVNESRFWDGDELESGPWEIVAHDVSGAWGEKFVVVGIKFPF